MKTIPEIITSEIVTSGIVKSTIKSNEIDGEYYSDLQYLLTDNDYVTGGKKLDYYYFVSVMNTTYDFWNSNAGYQEGYVIVLNNYHI